MKFNNVCVIQALVVALLLTACGREVPATAASAPPSTVQAAPSTTPPVAPAHIIQASPPAAISTPINNRIAYSEIFQINPDGSVSPRMPVQIGGVRMGPGVSFNQGAYFAGIDIAAMKGKNIEIERREGFVQIKGFVQ